MRSQESSGQSGVLVLLGVLFTIILAGLDNTIVSTVMPVALPELGDAHMYAWTFAAYMLAAAVSMPIWGPGSDRWGRRRTYLFGIVAFTAGSALCAVARTMIEFIGARDPGDPPHKRGRALGAVSSARAITSVAGPLLGTLIVTHVSWRWGFSHQRADRHRRGGPRHPRNARDVRRSDFAVTPSHSRDAGSLKLISDSVLSSSGATNGRAKRRPCSRYNDSMDLNPQPHSSTLVMSLPKAARTVNGGPVAYVDEFLTASECAFVISELEFAHWRPSHLISRTPDGGEKAFISPRRVSETANQDWFTDELYNFMFDVEQRLQLVVPFTPEHLEHWQATRYPVGGTLDHHLDAGYWTDHYAGERKLSFLIYLTTPLAGGSTYFRVLDLDIRAVAGRLLVWDNLFDNGLPNHKTVHSGAPLEAGEKITLVTWSRVRPFRIKRESTTF